MKYVASLSGGKDSVAMVLKLIELGQPLDVCVFFDTGMEFDALYRVIDEMQNRLAKNGIPLVRLRPERNFLLDMLAKPVNLGTDSEHFGYEWCGGRCRWETAAKQAACASWERALDDKIVEYIGIAADETKRAKAAQGRAYPLIEWQMTEADCLAYCRKCGISWKEGEVDLYDILDRVSCWCCANKNLRELRNMRRHLPEYWAYLKGLQSRIDRPFRKDASIFDLDKRFEEEERQLTLF